MDLEGGTAQLDVKRAEVSSWEEILTTIDELAKDPQGFETFVMDTADWAERMCSAYLCKKYKKMGIEDFGYGKAYSSIETAMKVWNSRIRKNVEYAVR